MYIHKEGTFFRVLYVSTPIQLPHIFVETFLLFWGKQIRKWRYSNCLSTFLVWGESLHVTPQSKSIDDYSSGQQNFQIYIFINLNNYIFSISRLRCSMRTRKSFPKSHSLRANQLKGLCQWEIGWAGGKFIRGWILGTGRELRALWENPWKHREIIQTSHSCSQEYTFL